MKIHENSFSQRFAFFPLVSRCTCHFFATFRFCAPYYLAKSILIFSSFFFLSFWAATPEGQWLESSIQYPASLIFYLHLPALTLSETSMASQWPKTSSQRPRQALRGIRLPLRRLSEHFRGLRQPLRGLKQSTRDRQDLRGVIKALRAVWQALRRLLEASEAKNRLSKFRRSWTPLGPLPHQYHNKHNHWRGIGYRMALMRLFSLWALPYFIGFFYLISFTYTI